VVYCGGLENRFGFTADGGSNPSLSARKYDVSTNLISILIWVVLVLGAFAWLWWSGNLARFAAYVQATREELRKCTWPSWDELKGSTVVISISIVLLGGFTILVDYAFVEFFYILKL
jgi:preprotein translocase subunit SecE